MSVMNQAYSKLNSAKVKDGLARRRAAGHYAIGMALSATPTQTALLFRILRIGVRLGSVGTIS